MDDIIIDIGAANSSAIGLTINDLIISVFEYTLYNGEFVLQLNNSNKPVLDISRDVIVYLLPQSLLLFFVLKAVSMPLYHMNLMDERISTNFSFF